MTPWELAAALLAGCALLWALFALSRYRRRNLLRERALRGQCAEEAAFSDLRRRFVRVRRHPRLAQRLWIDGAEHRYELCPDFLVGSRRRPVLVEVKSGKDRDPRDPSTRRQLLEYALAFRARKIGLYDAHTRTLQWIEIECLPCRRLWPYVLCFFSFLGGLALGLAAQSR